MTPQPLPDFFRLTIFTFLSLAHRDGLDRLLDAMERHHLTPTLTGKDERAKTRYDRSALEAKISAEAPTVVALIRKIPNANFTYFLAKSTGLTSVVIQWKSMPEDLSMPYTAGEDLASSLHAELAMVHPMYFSHDEFSRAGILELNWLQRYGPGEPTVRVIYGPHIVHLIGVDRVCEAAGAFKKLEYGGVEIDVLPRPWEAELSTLVERQREVQQLLAASHVLGDYSDEFDIKQGANWTPIPNPLVE